MTEKTCDEYSLMRREYIKTDHFDRSENEKQFAGDKKNRGTSFNEVFAAALVGQATSTTPNGITAGDLYNQSVFFKSDATGITSCSIEINNTPLMPQPLEDDELYNETLIALGGLNQDMSSGIYPGCYFLAHFLKYYFTHIVSLENIQQGDFYKSGLDGK